MYKAALCSDRISGHENMGSLSREMEMALQIGIYGGRRIERQLLSCPVLIVQHGPVSERAVPCVVIYLLDEE